MSQPRNAIANEVAALTDLVARERLAAQQGDVADLTALTGRVDALCRDVMALPSEQGRMFRPQMLGLMDELNALSAGLSSGIDAIRHTLGQAADGRRAARAYRAPDAAK